MLTDATKATYLRAAEALENHEGGIVDDQIAGQAWMAALDVAPDPEDYDAVDIDAALLLRECVAKGEPLP